LWVSCVVR